MPVTSYWQLALVQSCKDDIGCVILILISLCRLFNMDLSELLLYDTVIAKSLEKKYCHIFATIYRYYNFFFRLPYKICATVLTQMRFQNLFLSRRADTIKGTHFLSCIRHKFRLTFFIFFPPKNTTGICN
jgi:hypothetical protein